jgi:uncharacterized YigZ family protein
MQFVSHHFTQTLEEKRSKFITHIFPFDQFDPMMEKLKEEHPKARHFVYAYRYLNEFDQIVENSSDDGEPKGTSGKPSLAVLSGAELINTAVIIVRYFGGIRLGTGGLVRAYSDAVNLVIQKSEIFPYIKLFVKQLSVDYADLSKIEYQIKQFDIVIAEKKFDLKVTLILSAAHEEFENLSVGLPREYLLEECKEEGE